MKHIYKITLVMILSLFVGQTAFSQLVSYQDSRGEQGFTVQQQNMNGVKLNYSINQFTLKDQPVDGTPMKTVLLPDVFLPNDEGAPDLPGISRYIMIPAGAEVNLKMNSSRVESMKNVDIAPAPRIPLDTENGPMLFVKDQSIYSTDAFYPAQPVLVSEPMQIRGVDVVMLGITPFQYNPVSKELLVYRDIEVEVEFIGGTKSIGENRLRSRWWDQIIHNTVLNPEILPVMDYNKQSMAPSDSPDYEYLIISPDDATFLAWADSIKNFRMLQGIYTGIVTTTEIGGNTVSAIENYVDNAYNSWTVAPSAVLLLGDYSTGSDGITSQMFSHPAGYPDFVSDSRFADVNGDDLPDIVFARITANNAAQLEVMITKFLDYERNPPTSAYFYDHPITALGWQTERWFQICSEVVGGYLKNVKGKNPVRINAVYSGNPTSDPWSTATNTSTVLNYFGPNGLGYIPGTPQELGGFSGGTATDVVNAINNGSYMLQHRDHGYYGGWGEPAFSTTSINSLNNMNNELPFIFSINCQTGAFHRSTESFAEKFHRHTYNGQNSGALGIIAATEVSYSFVNDTYVWGVFDNMHPDFMPDKSTTFPVNYAMPAFGNAAGKHFLAQSSWPYNTSNKQITYRLFHHHGDAFLTMYTEVPQSLTVNHSGILQAAATTFTVDADAGSLIAITVNGDIVATADGTGSPLDITIPQQNPGDVMIVTVTKQNYFRYSANVDVVSSGLFAQFSADQTSLCAGGSVNFTDDSYGNPTSWSWSFPGGSPSSFNGQTPPAVSYATAGTYDVSLTVSDGSSNDTQTKTGYITVNSLLADFTGSPTLAVVGSAVNFTDNSTCNPTSWSWTFAGGTPSTSTAQNPVITYNTAGVYEVSLTASNGTENDTETKTAYITVSEVPLNYCTSQGSNYSYEWIGQVDFDGFSNPSGAAGYTDFTNLEVDMTAGASVDVTLTPAFSSSTYVEYWRIWIDYNRDGDFEDAGEEVFAPASSSAVVNGSFTVSSSAVGKTRMRVSMKWNAVQTSCETFSYGEVEDYTVNFISQSPPVANFTGSPTTVLEGETVNFTDLSTNAPTGWSWTFNGGSPGSSSAQNPSVIYNNAGTYSVSLTATNAGGSDTETKVDYITVVALPGCAGIVSPANATSNVGLDANLQWSAATDATGYKLYFGTNNPPSNIINGDDLGNVLSYDPGTLSYETTYYWQVVAYNAYGNATGCSNWSFTTEDAPILPPGCASLASPANGATGTLVTADLDWNDVAEADGYKIYFGTDNPPTNIENGTDLGTATLYNPTGDLAYSTTYYWKVVAYNAGGDATSCATWSFTTENEPILPPGCVSQVGPANGATGTLVTADLDWIGVAEADGYKIFFGTDNPPTNIENGTDLGAATLYNPSGDLAYSTTYYWKVVAYNAGGDASGCATWSFTTEDAPILPPGCVSLIGPANGATGTLVTADLDWNGVAEADGYKIFFGTDNPPTNIENGTDLGNVTLYNPSGDLAYSTTYYWKVVAYNAGGDATGCATWSFTTEDAPILPPGCASLASPANGATETLVTADLDWNGVAEADGYKIFFGTDNPPTNIENGTDLGTATLYNPSGDLAYETTYFWKVIAYNAGGDATGCATWSFTTEDEVILPPGCAGLVSPANGISGTLITADLDWNGVAEADGYKIYFGTDNPPTNIENGTDLGAATLYNPSGDLAYSTTYYWKVVAYNAGGDASGCATWSFTTEDQTIAYCASQGNNYSYEWIGQVDFDGFSNPSGASGYTDFTSLQVDMTAGADVNVTLTPAFSGSTYVEYWRIWIDYNQDGDFEDGGEEVFVPASSTSTINGSFTVSPVATGQTRMRVSMKWNGIPEPCETFTYGEVEDYTVNFIAPSPPVANFSAGTTTVVEGETVNFTDLSTNAPTSWSWNFNGGSPASSTAQNPSVIYDTEGTFTVSLTATNASGSDTETKTNFITVVSLPGCAAIVAPGNGATDVALDADLQWSAGLDATGYKLYFGTNNPPSNIVNGTDLGNALAWDPGTLSYGMTYFWKVVSYNEYGDATGCSTWSFTTEDAPVLPPGCVSLVGPANGATGTLVTANLDWNGVAEADGYKIFFGTDNPPTNIENGTDLGTATLYNPSGDLAYETTYYWKVVAYNVGGEATGCATWSFTTEDEPGGGPVQLLYSDFEDGFGLWTDGGGDCFLYTSGTYASQGNNAGAIQDNSGIASSFYLTNGIDLHSPGYMQLDIQFTFYAYSMDNSNEDFWVQYFDGAVWHTVAAFAQGIHFENNQFYTETVTVFETDYAFPTDMKIRFMCDASGNADDVYIDEISIMAMSDPVIPECTTLSDPANGAVDVDTFTSLDWNPVDYATGYKVYLGTDNPPTNIQNGFDVGDELYFYPEGNLNAYTNYYWKIVPYNDFGDASGCSVWSFTTGAASSIVELSFTDFESGWDIWTDGGGDCFLYTEGLYASQGSNAALIRDNSGVASSFYHTDGVDIHTPGYVQLDVEFDYHPESMDNTSEDFWVQYFDGSVWNTVATYARGIDFENGYTYSTKVSILESQYNFPTDMKIRFMCDASGNIDYVYIDMIRITASTDLIPDITAKGSDEKNPTGIGKIADGQFGVYPNPATTALNIALKGEAATVSIYALRGELIREVELGAGEEMIDVSDLEKGMYILHVVSGEEVHTTRFIKN